jgi:hypothetical protein
VDVEPPVKAAGLRERDDRATPGGFRVNPAVRTVEPRVAVIVAVVTLPTALVVTVNVAVEAPERTVTVAGTTADPLELESETTFPPTGAAPLSVIVPVEGEPPVRLVGLKATETRSAGLTVIVAGCVEPGIDAVRRIPCAVATGEVVTMQEVELVPAPTVTVAGTAATVAFALLRETVVPPVGANPVRVTVPVDTPPPRTVFGERVNAAMPGGVTVRDVVRVSVPSVAVIVRFVDEPTGDVATLNVAVEEAADTVTDDGTDATRLFEPERLTRRPPAAAGALRVTVPVVADPPPTLAGETETDERTAV